MQVNFAEKKIYDTFMYTGMWVFVRTFLFHHIEIIDWVLKTIFRVH